MSISLRTILLIIGGIIIAFIAIDAFRRNRKKRKLQEKRFERGQSHNYGKPIDELSADLDDILLVDEGPDLLEASQPEPRAKTKKREHEEPNILFDDFDSDDGLLTANYDDDIITSSSYDQKQPPSYTAEKPVAKPKQDGVMILHVLAEDDLEYEGRSLIRLLTSLGLRFGDKGIFHRHESHQLKSNILFNVASAVEPGIFNVKDADNFSTPGVTMFFLLSSVDDPLNVYELMLETASRLAECLDAEIVDERHNPLTPQVIATQRQRILNFMQQEELEELM